MDTYLIFPFDLRTKSAIPSPHLQKTVALFVARRPPPAAAFGGRAFSWLIRGSRRVDESGSRPV